MIRLMIFVSLLLTSSAFAGNRSIQSQNPAAPMYHTGEPAYSGYCSTDPEYCMNQSYGQPTYRRSYQAPRSAPAHRTSRVRRHR